MTVIEIPDSRRDKVAQIEQLVGPLVERISFVEGHGPDQITKRMWDDGMEELLQRTKDLNRLVGALVQDLRNDPTALPPPSPPPQDPPTEG